MVTVLRSSGLRVVIFANDHPPAHVHVVGDGNAKIDISGPEPRIVLNTMRAGELRKTSALVAEHRSFCSQNGKRFMGDFEFPSDAVEAATLRAAEEKRSRPDPEAVRYDAASGRLIVEFTNGSAFMVPARSLQDLENASDEDLAEVELLGGYALHWEKLDVDFTVQGLMAGLFGTARFMRENQAKGGRSRSPAKVASARENGKKGGRPRKSA